MGGDGAGVTVTATAEVGDYTGDVEATVEGDPTTIAFNARYLNDVLGNVDADRFSLELNGPLSPGVFRPVGDDGLRPRRDARPDDLLTDPRPRPALAGRRDRPDPARACRSATCAATRRSTPSFEPGPQLVWGPNAAGKTSLLEAIVLLAWGRSHRTSADGELVRWGQELARVEARVGRPGRRRPRHRDAVEVALVRTAGGGARKRIRVNGVARRAAVARRASCGP